MGSNIRNKLASSKDQIVSAYKNGTTLRELAELHEVSAGTVRNLLVEEGVTMRARGRRKMPENEPKTLPVEEVLGETPEVEQFEFEYNSPEAF